MSQPPSKAPTPAASVRLLGHSLREVTGLLSKIQDTARFAEGLERLIRRFPELESASLTVLSAEDSTFPPPLRRQLSLPVSRNGKPLAQLSIPDQRGTRRQLRPEDLQLLSALAEMIGALLETSHRVKELETAALLLQHLLDLLPVGVLWTDRAGAVLKANHLARRYLQLDNQNGSPALQLLPRGEGAHFTHFEIGGSLLFARSHSIQVEDQPPHGHITLIYDLSLERERIHQHLVSETYRCKLQGSPLSVLCLQSEDPEALQQWRPEFEEALDPEDRIGTGDARTLVIVFAGKDRHQSMRWLRKRPSLFATPSLQMGLHTLLPSDQNGTELLQQAQQKLKPAHEFLKPSVLICDSYAPVLDALESILQPDFNTWRANSPDSAASMLHRHPIDMVIAETDTGTSGDQLRWNEVLSLGSGLPVIETTTGAASLEGSTMLHKPFQPQEVRRILSELWPEAFRKKGERAGDG